VSGQYQTKGDWIIENGSVILNHPCFFAELKDDGSWDIHEKIYSDEYRLAFNTTNLKKAIERASKWT